MTLNNKSTGSGNSKGGGKAPSTKEKIYRKIGSMWKSKHFDGHNMSMDDYSGDLIFRDKESGKFYKVKGASLFEPKEGAPENLIYNMVINLASEYDVQEMDGSEDSEEGQEQEEEQEQESRFSKRRG